MFDDGQPIYLGEEQDRNRHSISLKTGFYLFCNDPDNLVEQYRIVHSLLAMKNDRRFISRLRRGLFCLFMAVRDAVKKECKSLNGKITSIGLTIPAQWTMDFQDQYQAIISEVFEIPAPDIIFHTETEAMAHVLLTDYQHRLSLTEPLNVIVFLDFGGHNMVRDLDVMGPSASANGSCHPTRTGLFSASCKDQLGRASIGSARSSVSIYFSSTLKPVLTKFNSGAAGGSELWEYEIGELCRQKVKSLYDCFPSRESKKDFLDRFNAEKMRLGPVSNNQKGSFRAYVEEADSGRVYKLILDAAEIDDAFERALAGPLDIATNAVKLTAAACKNHDPVIQPKVVVSGGSCRNLALMARLRQICKEASIEQLTFTSELNIKLE